MFRTTEYVSIVNPESEPVCYRGDTRCVTEATVPGPKRYLRTRIGGQWRCGVPVLAAATTNRGPIVTSQEGYTVLVSRPASMPPIALLLATSSPQTVTG